MAELELFKFPVHRDDVVVTFDYKRLRILDAKHFKRRLPRLIILVAADGFNLGSNDLLHDIVQPMDDFILTTSFQDGQISDNMYSSFRAQLLSQIPDFVL
jgi:hypothetical protein